ncbi:hypothetical protein ACJ72_02926 [Emergomyces africanus]|uniref:Uncharacterized protein n=1 Tax=Emergomyces africanus TaxID=1955775 RepID=A0A1B7P120_9EURO|nr:hypothetical protein ACJ72_02926 [Emergomyces africanus]
MIRQWISILLLALAVISSVSAAVDFRLAPRDNYLDDYLQFGRGKRQNNDQDPVIESPTLMPERSINTPRDTGADISTPIESGSISIPTPTETPPPTNSNSSTDTPPPETSLPTTPPPSTTESQTPPPESSTTTTSNSSTFTTTSSPPTSDTPSTTTTPPKSSTTFIQTTNPDGSPATITSVVIVQPSPTKPPGDGPLKPPGLQTGGTPSVATGVDRGVLAAVSVSGVIALAMML